MMNHKSEMKALGIFVIISILGLIVFSSIIVIVLIMIVPDGTDIPALIQIPFTAAGAGITGMVTIASIIVGGKRGREIAQSITGKYYDDIVKGKQE